MSLDTIGICPFSLPDSIFTSPRLHLADLLAEYLLFSPAERSVAHRHANRLFVNIAHGYADVIMPRCPSLDTIAICLFFQSPWIFVELVFEEGPQPLMLDTPVPEFGLYLQRFGAQQVSVVGAVILAS